ncbi:hypothetical protein CYLTODRAFT_458224 [Cylindrobasidium torrendii FP15055 ss-10]|uniref:Uncharacterized protein n=1 Tax=Cylindrobasidium torrendii FP15055 ss-10 TaxID=1314674 RepID=A0A0D7AYN6_9AGAR|nr:hypothetical protein CYLTODRAFT_458224 [Cylindrobasidium torrendii FP15055 ss-10]
MRERDDFLGHSDHPAAQDDRQLRVDAGHNNGETTLKEEDEDEDSFGPDGDQPLWPHNSSKFDSTSEPDGNGEYAYMDHLGCWRPRGDPVNLTHSMSLYDSDASPTSTVTSEAYHNLPPRARGSPRLLETLQVAPSKINERYYSSRDGRGSPRSASSPSISPNPDDAPGFKARYLPPLFEAPYQTPFQSRAFHPPRLPAIASPGPPPPEFRTPALPPPPSRTPPPSQSPTPSPNLACDRCCALGQICVRDTGSYPNAKNKLVACTGCVGQGTSCGVNRNTSIASFVHVRV